MAGVQADPGSSADRREIADIVDFEAWQKVDDFVLVDADLLDHPDTEDAAGVTEFATCPLTRPRVQEPRLSPA